MLLRIFQGGDGNAPELDQEPKEIKNRLAGIRDIWSTAYDSHMAVALGEFNEEKRRLWLFRNEFRNICVVDLLDKLGQVFFVSTPEIWHNSIKNIELGFDYQIIQLPTEEVYLFELNEQVNLTRYQIQSEGIQNWQVDKFLSFEKPKIDQNVHTNLNNKEECVDYFIENYNKSKDLLCEITNKIYEIEGIIETEQDLNFELIFNKFNFLEKEIEFILKNIKK